MQMQTTLDCPATASSTPVTVEPRNSTILSDEHIEYLYRNSSEAMLDIQIEQKLREEKQETDELRRRYEEFQQYDTPKKSQKYIRVGKRC